MDILQIALALSGLLCSLVAGFLFAFAVVVIPGIKNLDDHNFLQAFRVMDRVIQNNQPLFILVWIGSVVVLLTSAVIGFAQLDGLDRLLSISALAAYILGVQIPTLAVNVPLNNRIQRLNFDTTAGERFRDIRVEFESRWIPWNAFRTVIAILTSALLIVLVIRLS